MVTGLETLRVFLLGFAASSGELLASLLSDIVYYMLVD